jgi:oligopeptide transport system substrate-binding protein
MRKFASFLAGAATLLLAALMVHSCAPAPDSGGSVLNRASGGEPESLDIHKVTSSAALRVLRDLGEGLLGYSPGGELSPAVAESWEISEDGIEYRFHLRADARWSNGDAVTADNFVASFRRLVDPATAAIYSRSIAVIENAEAILAGELPAQELGATAVDEKTLVVRLKQPVPYFLGLLTHPSMFPLHAESVAEHGDAHTKPGNYVNNGAYKLDKWQVQEVIEVSRNEFYHDNENTSIDRVRWLVTPESMVELNRYRAGELHITDNVPPDAFKSMREERPDELRVAPYLNVYYYGYNLTREPFIDNEELRLALSMAIDRETLTIDVIGRGEEPAYSFVPPGVNNYQPQTMSFASMTVDQREEKARQLYRDAGYGPSNPLEIELRYNTSDVHRRIAVAIQSMWKEVLGFEADLINEDFQVLLANMRAKQVTQVFRSGWSGDYNDAHSFLQLLLSDNPSNLTGYSSKEFDSLMQTAEQQTRPNSRRLYLEEAEKVMLRDQPLIPIYFYVSKHMVSPRVRGWRDNVLDYHYSRHLSLTDE